MLAIDGVFSSLSAMNHPGETQRIWTRALKIASEEKDFFFKSLKAQPSEFRERIAGVTIRFDERPSLAMVERGVSPEALSLVERDDKVVVLFLMSLYDRYGKFAGDFRRELRRVLCEELAGLTGMDWLGELEP